MKIEHYVGIESRIDWIVSDTIWPKGACFSITSGYVEIPSKIHGKDLPIDITQSIKPASNWIVVSISQWNKLMTLPFFFYLVVEVVEVLRHDQIVSTCKKQQHIPPEQTLNAFKRSFARSPSSDDDCAIVISDLSIDLADPFTTNVF